MLFNSFHYILFLTVVVLVIGTLQRQKFQHTFLLFASYYFYWAFSSAYVILVLVSTVVDFFCGRAIFRASSARTRKLFLILSLTSQLGLLGYFKYTNFAINVINAALATVGSHSAIHHLDIVLPVGISFYTFMSLSYTIDIYRGRYQPIDSFKTFALFLTFFPHLVAGPILRAAAFLPQLKKGLVITADNLQVGITLILYGLIKKVVFADNLSPFVNQTFRGDLTHDSLAVIVGVIAFAVEIYCDFSGYTDIAIGSARILGLEFPGNFDHPYFSRNVSEFWHRWHISLSSWLRDYLYFPLGGSRGSRAATLMNLLVTMVLGGLWHGAAWNFGLWGLYQGLLLAGHKLLLADRDFLSSRFWDPLKLICTFWLTCIGWLIFLLSDVHKIIFYTGKLLLIDFTPSNFSSFVSANGTVVLVLVVFFAAHTLSYYNHGLVKIFARQKPIKWYLYAAAGIVALYLFARGQQQSFIYFQF